MRLIDADALMDDVSKRYCEECEKRRGIKKGKQTIVYEIGDAPCRACSIDDMKCELETAPTIEERKKGEWRTILYHIPDDGNELYEHYCSECKKTVMISNLKKGRFNYCPNCGAKMEVEHAEV